MTSKSEIDLMVENVGKKNKCGIYEIKDSSFANINYNTNTCIIELKFAEKKKEIWELLYLHNVHPRGNNMCQHNKGICVYYKYDGDRIIVRLFLNNYEHNTCRDYNINHPDFDAKITIGICCISLTMQYLDKNNNCTLLPMVVVDETKPNVVKYILKDTVFANPCVETLCIKKCKPSFGIEQCKSPAIIPNNRLNFFTWIYNQGRQIGIKL